MLVCLGRASLTLLIAHILLLRESAVRLGFWRSFSAGETLLATVVVLALAAVLAHQWRRVGFRFGAEWLLRKLAGSR